MAGITHGYEIKEAGGGFTVNGHPWHVTSRYKDLRYLTTGSNGVICHAVEAETSNRVVISKRDGIYSKAYCQRNLRDLQIVSRLQKLDDFVVPTILDVVCYPSSSEANMSEVYVVQDSMEVNLEQVLQSKLPDFAQTKFLMYQLLRALKLFHSAGIIHRCIRPNHLLVNSECELRVCDFRLAAINGIESDPNFELMRFTDSYRVNHLHYWSPEVLVNESLTPAADIWSAGCIFAELLTGQCLFDSADVQRQFSLFLSFVGPVSVEDLDFIASESSRAGILSIPLTSTDVKQRFDNVDHQAMDLLCQMLAFNPRNRISATDALEHPFFSELHDPIDEPVYSEPVSFADQLLTCEENVDSLRLELSKEIQRIIASFPAGVPPTLKGHTWYVNPRYQDLSFITTGSNGTLCYAFDTVASKRVAISKRDGLYSPEYCRRNLQEIQILSRLQRQCPEDYLLLPRILDILCYPPGATAKTLKELYVVQPAMDVNLEQILATQSLTTRQIWYITYSLLTALNFLHSANIVHRCVRPRHILLTSTMELVLCDLRRSILCQRTDLCEEYKWTYTSTDGSWCYLAPEALYYEELTPACDVWSAGCILGEMLIRKPLFPADANAANLLRLIIAGIGLPTEEDLSSIKSEIGVQKIRELYHHGAPTLDDMLQGKEVDPNAADLLKKVLVFSPTKRISASEALQHPFFDSLHDPADEPVYGSGTSLIEELFSADMTLLQLKEKLLSEVKLLAS